MPRTIARASAPSRARTIGRRTYLTGGMGSHHTGESFGDDFVLPPDRAYAETAPGRTTWFAARAISAALALAEGKRTEARELVERTTADYATSGFGWRRYVDRLTEVREQLLG